MLPQFYKVILCSSLVLISFQTRSQLSAPKTTAQYDSVEDHTFEYAAADQHKFYFQDSRGFLWGAGKDMGLIRFDGHQIQSFAFDFQDSNSYSGCPLWPNDAEILEDSQGKIWIKSSRRCLDRYDPATGHFDRIGKRFKQGQREHG